MSGRGQADPGFLPAQVTRMFLRHIREYEPGVAEHHTWAAESRHRRAPAGPAVKYQLEWFHHDKSDNLLRRGDVVVFVTADHEWLYAPAVVDSEAIAIPRSPGAVGHLLRSRTDLDPIPVRRGADPRRGRASGCPAAGRSSHRFCGPRCLGSGTSKARPHHAL